MLFVMLCVCGYFGGYRRGYEVGGNDRWMEDVHDVLYDLPDGINELSPKRRDVEADKLIDWVTSNLAHYQWGDNDIAVENGRSLRVTATGAAQRDVKFHLDQLNELWRATEAERLIPEMQSLASKKASNGGPCLAAAEHDDYEGKKIVENRFTQAVNAVASRWGEPDWQGGAGDRGFPKWSPDRRMAYWRRVDGVVYLSIHDNPEFREIHAGWRDDHTAY